MTDTGASIEGAVAFTDLVGYTEYTATRGDAEALMLLSAQDRIVGAALPPRDGRVVKELGDGLLLFFRTPVAAIECCLDLLERFEQAAADNALPLWVRIGVHFGRPTRRGDDLIGHDVNVAARIVDVAAPGELLCSDAAVTAAGTHLTEIDFAELGPVVMKGIPEPIALYRAERSPAPLRVTATGTPPSG